MEKVMKFGVIVLFTFFCSACTIRTPERILKQQFNISLKGFDYQVETFEDDWFPNGDGSVYIVFKFNTLTEDNIKYFQSAGFKDLPILEHQEIPDRFLFENGYYLLERDNPADERDFKLFVVDTDHNKAVLY